MFIIPGSWGQNLAKSLVDQGRGELGEVKFTKFPDGEKRIQLGGLIEGQEVMFVQSMAPDPDAALVEILLAVDALRESGVSRVIVFISYLGYSLTNRHFEGESVSARAVARAISSAEPDEVWLYDLHASHIVEYFSVPVKLYDPIEQFTSSVEKLRISKGVIVAPDDGAEDRARVLSENLGLPYVVAKKVRDENTTEIKSLDIDDSLIREGTHVIIVDDMVNTGETVMRMAEVLKGKGVKRITLLATHFLGVKGSLERILSSIDKLITTNSVDHGLKSDKRIEVLEIIL